MMQAIQIAKNGPAAQVLEQVQIPVPAVGKGMVRVKVKAVSLNPIDYKVVETEGGMSAAGWSNDLPFTPGYDISGQVDEVGEDVVGFVKGDQVFAVNWGSGKHDDETKVTGGGLAEYAIVPFNKLSRKPSGISHEEAAGIALVGLTARQALDNLGVKQDSRVLILGGAGAVGTVAIQLAKARGAWVATTASPRTKDYVVSVGKPDLVIDYTTSKWDETSELVGIDAIFDAIGESEGFQRAKAGNVIREGGSFLSIAAFDAGFDPTAHKGFKYAAFYALSNSVTHQYEIAQMLADKTLTLPVEETFPFTEQGVKAAFAKQAGGKSKGKNVVVFP